MKIYDQTKTTLLQEKDCDLKKGRLDSAKLVVGKRKSLKEITKDENGNIIETTYPKLEIEEDILLYIPFTQKELYEIEQSELKEWFIGEYAEQYQKCKRRIELGRSMRDGTDPKERLKEIYEKAEKFADRINELDLLIKGEKK